MQTRPARWIARVEPVAYALFAGAWVLWIATRFYGSMVWQNAMSAAAGTGGAVEWSAPLDDVYIHFDFARATARGHPFQWSEGNGYSSGGTSLLYPLVLALPYWAGVRDHRLVLVAGVLACTALFAALLAGRRLFRGLPRATAWLLPPFLLGVGGLSWTYFSGMEVALLLGLAGGTLVAFDDLLHGEPGRLPPEGAGGALRLGAWGALLVATRPEAATTVALLGALAARVVWRRAGLRAGALALLAAGLPASLLVAAHSLANLWFTGAASAAGAVTKLEIHHPYLTASEVLDKWCFHMEYQLRRLAEHHLSVNSWSGYLPLALAASGLLLPAVRARAATLLAAALGYACLVALNGQVRWQNERYAMPPLAFVMAAAAVATGGLLTQAAAWLAHRRGSLRLIAAAELLAVLAALGLFARFQAPRYREQVWFFGRACRNIRDQHLTTGRLLRSPALTPRPLRVAVGDAGAIPWASDLPSVDLIGLGGLRGYPFALASRLGAGSVLELLERMPGRERPDLLALYPSWWGELPLYFGERIGEVPISGNVICGGASKVLYRPRWEPFEGSATPRVAPAPRVVATLDLADVLSEREHGLVVARGKGHVVTKLLADPREPGRDLFDAGRLVDSQLRAEVRAAGAGRLLLRLAPEHPVDLWVEVDGERQRVRHPRADAWTEVDVPLPRVLPDRKVPVALWPEQGVPTVYHLWFVE